MRHRAARRVVWLPPAFIVAAVLASPALGMPIREPRPAAPSKTFQIKLDPSGLTFVEVTATVKRKPGQAVPHATLAVARPADLPASLVVLSAVARVKTTKTKVHFLGLVVAVDLDRAPASVQPVGAPARRIAGPPPPDLGEFFVLVWGLGQSEKSHVEQLGQQQAALDWQKAKKSLEDYEAVVRQKALASERVPGLDHYVYDGLSRPRGTLLSTLDERLSQVQPLAQHIVDTGKQGFNEPFIDSLLGVCLTNYKTGEVDCYRVGPSGLSPRVFKLRPGAKPEGAADLPGGGGGAIADTANDEIDALSDNSPGRASPGAPKQATLTLLGSLPAGSFPEQPVYVPASLSARPGMAPVAPPLYVTLLKGNAIARLDPGSTQPTLISTLPGTAPAGATLGPDGRLWFTLYGNGELGALDVTAPKITLYSLPSPTSKPAEITVGADGALWFSEFAADKIGRIATDGKITEYPLTPGSAPLGITLGADGAVWFAERKGNRLGRLTWYGKLTEIPIDGGNDPVGIISAPDGSIYWTEFNGGRLGQLTFG